MKSYDVTIGSISWIAKESPPIWWAFRAKQWKPDWVPKTFMGLYATANSSPSPRGINFTAFAGQKDFRALTYGRVQFSADETTGRVSELKLVDSILDPGWTPPFDRGSYPVSRALRDKDINDRTNYPGELSPISGFKLGELHPNSSLLGIPREEVIVASALVKFRAGDHTDKVGVGPSVGCPYHVPWVWCETCLTLIKGRLRVRGRGSLFPSHAWYLNSDQVGTRAQAWDSTFPMKTVSGFIYGSRDSWAEIDVPSLKLYPVLSVGAPASGAQPPANRDLVSVGSVDNHAYTAPGGSQVQTP